MIARIAKNITSIEIDQATQPALALIRGYLETEQPTEEQAQKVNVGMRMLGIGVRRYGAENTRASLAMKAAAFTGSGPDSVKEALSIVIDKDAPKSASGSAPTIKSQQVTGKIEPPKQSARKRNGK